MPQMVTLIPNPEYRADAATKASFEAAKKRGPFQVDYPTALENVKLSGGMYKIQQDEAAQTTAPRQLEDMSNEELKLLMLQTGITPQKQMKRAEIIKAIQIKLGEVEITDDE